MEGVTLVDEGLGRRGVSLVFDLGWVQNIGRKRMLEDEVYESIKRGESP